MKSRTEIVSDMILRLKDLGAEQDAELAFKSFFLENDLNFGDFLEIVNALHMSSTILLRRKTENLEDDGDQLYDAVVETLLATAQLSYMIGTLFEAHRQRGTL